MTHDRYFLDNAAQWILELDRGQGIPFEGNYSSWLEQKQTRMKIEEKQNKARQKALEKELDWIRMAPKARQAKSKARINAYEQMASEEFNERPEEFEIQIPPGPNLGNLVIRFKDVHKAFDDKVLMEDLSFELPAGGIVGIIGPNGAGKTTMFRMITGEQKPDSGTLEIGETVELGYVDQSRDSLDAEKTVYEEISGGHETLDMGGRKINARGYVSKFNFRGPDQEKKVGVLSGGERNRVHLAKLLRRGSNVLMLDEPTNDLDLDTLDLLQELIADYAGTVILVSHDRDFIDRTVTSVLVSDGDGHWQDYAGGYTDMLAQRGAKPGSRLGAEKASKPKAAKAAPAVKKKGKLSFNQQHALKTLPAQIDKLTDKISKIEQEMAAPDLFGKNPDRFSELAKKLEAAQTSLAQKEEQWLELEMLSEELNS